MATVSPTDDFIIVAGVLEKYVGDSYEIFIPENTVIIGDNCFMGMEPIKKLILPYGITKIGNNAFFGCQGLEHINFPETIVNIGDSAFRNTGIQEVILHESIEHIGKNCFMGCAALKKVYLPEKTIIYNGTFKQCKNLQEVSCNLNNFCLSFKPSNEAKKGNDKRPTLFDAFQATPFLDQLHNKQLNKQCILCSEEIDQKGICNNCGACHVDLSKGCYIATAIYGSYDCPQVWTLRRFRDTTLEKTWYGRAFIKIYYKISPVLVKLFGKKKWFNKIWKKRLNKIVSLLEEKGIQNTPYKD